jgi:hypothetical protein
MQRHFSAFHSHLELAHQYWEKILQPGDWAIDATSGNGNDTLKLAQILASNGTIIGIDIQEEAIMRTQALLKSKLTSEALTRIHLHCQSHTDFPIIASSHPIRLVVYNLGYLPKGDKSRTTLTTSTLESIHKALNLVMPGGAISIMCYPGHEEGAKEEKAIIEEVSQLSSHLWSASHHRFINRLASPSLILLQKADCFFQ